MILSDAVTTFKTAYLLPMYRNVTEKEFLYRVFCRTLGVGGYPSGFLTGIRRLTQLVPHVNFQIRSIGDVVYSRAFSHGKQSEIERGITAFKAILRVRESILKRENPYLLDSEETKCVSELIDSLACRDIDAIEWQLDLKDALHIWILRNLAYLQNDASINSLKEKCSRANLEKNAFEQKFTHREAAFLLCYSALEKLLACLSINISSAAKLLKKLHAIPQAEEVSNAIANELSNQFQQGDILLDNVPLKVDLIGLHLRLELQRIYLTQGAEFHIGIFNKDAAGMKENMMGVFGYMQKPLLPINLLPITVLRFEDEALQKKIAAMSNIDTKSEIHGFVEQCKSLFDLHENPETKALRKAPFDKKESCASFVAKIVVNALYEHLPTADNPFAGYDLNYMTPNSLKKALLQAGLVKVCAEPSDAFYTFLLPT